MIKKKLIEVALPLEAINREYLVTQVSQRATQPQSGEHAGNGAGTTYFHRLSGEMRYWSGEMSWKFGSAARFASCASSSRRMAGQRLMNASAQGKCSLPITGSLGTSEVFSR